MHRVLGRVVLMVGLTLGSATAFAQAPPAATSFPADDPAPPAPGTDTVPAPGETPPVAPTAPAPAPAPTPAEPPPSATPPSTPPAAYEPPAYEPPEPEAPTEKQRRGPYVSLTFSPLHLLIGPIFEMQIEAQVVPHFGVSLIGGIGTIKADDEQVGTVSFSAYELGGQLVGYPLADFKSLQLGAELMWVNVSTESVNGREITADAGGFAIGPLIGYKLVTQGGFTFFAQGGFQYLTARAEATNENGESASDESSTFLPLLNLNIGWSF